MCIMAEGTRVNRFFSVPSTREASVDPVLPIVDNFTMTLSAKFVGFFKMNLGPIQQIQLIWAFRTVTK